MSDSAPKLTKKQKKAQAFRSSKGKGKKGDIGDDQPDVPEEENLDAAELEPAVKEKKAKKEGGESKKRKREGEEDGGDGEGIGKEGEVEGKEGEAPEGERKKKRQRGKKKSQRDNSVTADGRPRFILFVGNLPYKVTTEAIVEHFKPCGETPVVRLLTPKPNPAATVSKSKGCAFVEFTLATALQSALRLHQSDFAGRKINVELSAGGGGNSEARKAKILEGRKRLDTERERATANKLKKSGEGGGKKEPVDKSARWGKKPEGGEENKEGAPSAVAAGGGEKEVKVNPTTGKKVRDRRIPKTTSEGVVKERARKLEAKRAAAMSGANNTPLGQ